jgi:hypothetical protein
MGTPTWEGAAAAAPLPSRSAAAGKRRQVVIEIRP